MEYFILIGKGNASDFRIQFVGKDNNYPTAMNKYSSIGDCFTDYEQSVKYFDLDKKGREIIKIAVKSIQELIKMESSFLVLAGTVEDKKVLFSFDDNISRRGKLSGPELHISSSFYPKTYINTLFKTFFKETFQYKRYYSTFNTPEDIAINVKFSL